MKKNLSRVISFALCVVMVIGMLSAFTVFAEDVNQSKVIYENKFDTANDLSKLYVNPGWDAGAFSLDATGGFSGGAAKYTFAKASDSQTRIFNVENITYKKGATYTISFRAKSSSNLNVLMMTNFSSSPYVNEDGKASSYSYLDASVTSDWANFSCTFNIKDFAVSTSDLTSKGIEQLQATILTNMYGFKQDAVLWIDDLIITEKIVDPTEANTIYDNKFNESTDVGRFYNNWPGNAVATFEDKGGVDGSGAVKYAFATTSSASNRIFNISSLKWKKGGTYVISFSAKASKETTMQMMVHFSSAPCLGNDGKANEYISLYTGISKDWKNYSISFTIKDFVKSTSDLTSKGINSLETSILTNMIGITAGESLLIDNFEITEKFVVPPTAPKAENVTISGTAQVSRTLTAEAEITDINKEDELFAEYQWQWLNDKTWTDISGASNKTYTIPESMLEKTLRVVVTPVSNNDPKNGEAVVSSATEAVKAFTYPPEVKDVSISGDVKIGEKITASYTYVQSQSNIEEGESLIIWETSASENGEYTSVQNSSDKNYTVMVKDAGMWLRARVVPKDKNGLEGTEGISSAKKVTGNVEFFVATNGDDNNIGTKKSPFASIEKARDSIRELKELPEGGVTVNIMGGTYPISDTIQFTEKDSGTKDKPIVYQAYNGEKVEFIGGKTLDSSKIQKVTDEKLLNRLIDKNAKSKLMMLDLGAQDVVMSELGPYGWGYNNYRPMRIYMNNSALIDARWPNDDESQCLIKCQTYMDGVDTTKFNGTRMPVKLLYPDAENRSARWNIKSGDACIGGAVVYFWASEQLRIDSIDANNKVVTTLDPSTYSAIPGAGWGQQHKIYFSNIFEEIDQPGESYIDREKNILYFYPVGVVNDASMVVSTLNKNMITATKTNYVTFRGIDFKDTIRTPVLISECEGISFENSEISNTSEGAVNMKNCTNSRISGCHFYNTCVSPIAISGGDRANLISSGNVMENNLFHNFSQMPHNRLSRSGIQISGCSGEIIRHNEFSDFPFGMIDISDSNNITIEYNKAINGEQRSTDAGAIYWGRDLTTLGIVIRYNYFENIGSKTICQTLEGGNAYSVFWDDAATGPEMYGNVFYNGGTTTKNGKGAAVASNGGEFGSSYGNISIVTDSDQLGAAMGMRAWGNDIKLSGLNNEKMPSSSYLYMTGLRTLFGYSGLSFSAYTRNLIWSDKWAEYYKDTQWNKAIQHYGQTRYDGAKKLFDASDKEGLIKYLNENITNNPTNHMHNNLALGRTAFTGNNNIYDNYLGTEKQITEEDKSLFVDFDGKNFALTSEGLEKVRKKAPKFEQIPFGEIGLISSFGVNKPTVTIKSEQVTGIPSAGNTISPLYLFSDPDGDIEGASKVYWYVADKKNGEYKMIAGKQGKYFDVTDEYSGRYLKYEFVPYDTNVIRGEAVMSEPIEVRKSGSVDITALSKAIADATDIVENAVVGSDEGMYEQASVDTLKKAIADASSAARDGEATKYQINNALSAINSAIDIFRASVITKLEYLNVSDMLQDKTNWVFMNESAPGEFKNGELLLPSGAIGTYTGKKYLNTIFTFRVRFESDLPSGTNLANYDNDSDYKVNNAFYVRLGETDTNLWNGTNTGYLLWFHNKTYEAQEWNPKQTMISYDNDIFTEYNKEYEIAMGAYDTAVGVRYIMYVDNKLVYDHTFSKDIIGKEGYVRFGATGGGDKVKMVISSGQVDYAELDTIINEAAQFTSNVTVGNGYSEYPEAFVAKVNNEVAKGEILKNSTSVSQLAVNKQALTIKNSLVALKSAANTEATVNASTEYDINYNIGSANISVGSNVPVTMNFKKDLFSPEISLSTVTENGVATLNIPAGSRLSGIGTTSVTNPVSVSAPSANVLSGIMVIGVYTASSGVVTSDTPVRILFPGANRYRVFYKNENGKYSEVKTKLTEDNAKTAKTELADSDSGKLNVGNDLVVYTKTVSEFVIFKSGTKDDNSDIEGGSTGGENASGGSVAFPAKGGSIGTSGFNSPGTDVFCFDDMVNHWAKDDVMNMYKAGIVIGVSSTTFEPDRNIRRAEFVAFIARALKLEDKAADYKDVTGTEWFAPFVGACSDVGIISGYDGMFRPNDNITREEMAVVIVNAYNHLEKKVENGGIDAFTDKADIADWAKPYVDIAASVGIISGMGDGTFGPNANATRAQAASVISRLIK